MLSNLLIILISLAVIGIMFGYLVQNYYFGLKEWEVTTNSQRIARLVSENISGGSIESDHLVKDVDKITTIARSTNMDIGLMNEQGKMVFNAPTIEDFNLTLEQSEVDHVLQGNTITKKIMGPEHRNLLMVLPLLETSNKEIILMGPQTPEIQTNVVGAVIIQAPLGGIAATINNIIRLVIYSFLVAIAAAILLSISFTKRVTRPLKDIQNSALKSAKGTYQEVSVPINSSDEIKHLVNTFNYAVKQINETMKKRKKLEKMSKKFVANVSHEFRAPLTSIKGFLEIINDGSLSLDEIKECSKIMYKDAEYLENLLTDLLTLGQLEVKQDSLKKIVTSPEILVSRAIKTMQHKLENKQIKIDLQIEENIPNIKVDPNRIHQVLINLLDNAIIYSPKDRNITIKVATPSTQQSSKTREKVKFSVIDEGPGIPEDELDNIWQRFYKIDTARTREQKNGSGLGLAIVKDVVLKHGGTVEVDSTLGTGSTFSFII